MKNRYIIIVVLISLLLINGSEANAQCTAISAAQSGQCYGASDFGLGGGAWVPANPDEKTADVTKSSKLLRTTPKSKQVAPWVPTTNDLRTTGVSAAGANNPLCQLPNPPASCAIALQRGVLKIYVDGCWFPWGQAVSAGKKIASCGPIACQGNGGTNLDINANNSVCFSGDGQRVDKGMLDANIPCELTGGWGLYGLIALKDPNTGIFPDPNYSQGAVGNAPVPIPDIAENPPSNQFRTFRIGPLQQDGDGYYYILDFSKQCAAKGQGANCIGDVNANGQSVVAEGKLYFQIKDRYYWDNSGGYSLNIVSGVYAPKGFIENLVTDFDTLLNGTTLYNPNGTPKVNGQNQPGLIQLLYTRIMADTGMITIVRAFLLFYVTMYGLMFMLGLAEAKANDMILRLLKVGIIATLISPTSWDFFNGYFFQLFTVGAKDIANHVLDATLYYKANAGTSPKFIIPNNATALSIYDIIVDQLTSGAINAKILGLIFYNAYFWIYIIVIYVAIFFAFIGIIRAVVLYFTAIILVAVLVFTAPIFLTMLLFQLTRQMFENWVQQLIAAALMLIILSATMTLLVLMLQNQIENLFSYGVCWQYVFTIFTKDYFFLNFNDINFWYPRSDSEIDTCVTPLNIIGFLLVCIVFEKIMAHIPQLIDSLSNAQLMPISRLSGGAMGKLEQTAARAEQIAGYGRAAVGAPADVIMSTKTFRESSVGRAYSKVSEGIEKAKRGVTESLPGKLVSKVWALRPDNLENLARNQDDVVRHQRANMSLEGAVDTLVHSAKATAQEYKATAQKVEQLKNKAEAIKKGKADPE